MIDRWYYTHGGQQYGPVSADDIQSLATRGLLLPDDLLWPDGFDRSTAIEAGAAIVALAGAPRQAPMPEQVAEPAAALPTARPEPATPRAARPASKLPDWLGDVRKSEQSAARPKAPEPASQPSWLTDIWKVEGAAGPASRPPQSALPEWISDVRPPEEPLEVTEIIEEVLDEWLIDPRQAPPP